MQAPTASINQPTNQPTNQLTNQNQNQPTSTKQPTHQSTSKSTNINQPINQPNNQLTNQHQNQPTSINQSTNQPTNQPTNGSIYASIHQMISSRRLTFTRSCTLGSVKHCCLQSAISTGGQSIQNLATNHRNHLFGYSYVTIQNGCDICHPSLPTE